MRAFLLLILLSGLSLTLFSQQTDSTKTNRIDGQHCEKIAFHTANKLSEDLSVNNFTHFKSNIDNWINNCGVSEFAVRLRILEQIISHYATDESIDLYFSNGYYYDIKYRLEDLKAPGYSTIYSNAKARYSYVPLRHKLDSVSMQMARRLLDTADLTKDERLCCILFSGGTEVFTLALNSGEYRNTQIRKYFKQKSYSESKTFFATNFFLGMHTPVGEHQIFKNSPVIGMGFATPLNKKFMFELAMKIRFHNDDKSFNYYAFGQMNTVNSSSGAVMGIWAGYKLYESDKFFVYPKVGIGLEMIDTGLSKEKENSNEVDYEDIETLHLTAGITFLRAAFIGKYLGLSIYGHFCPYRFDTNLKTDFDNGAISAELNIRI